MLVVNKYLDTLRHYFIFLEIVATVRNKMGTQITSTFICDMHKIPV